MSYRVHQDWLVQDVDVRFEPGDLHILLGANGAGKSSLLRVLSGEVVPSTGDVLLGGQTLTGYSAAEKAERMAVLPQRSLLDFPFVGREVIQMGLYGRSKSISKRSLDEVIEAFELQQLSTRRYTLLSGGEQQRVQIARVMAQLWDNRGDAVYLMDEPDSPLDLAHQISLFSRLKRLAREGATIVVSTHDLNLAVKFADRLTLLKKGKVLATGGAAQVLTPERIMDAYGVAAAVEMNDRGRIQIDYLID
jgi:iron complex transport system ATP-binding protein